MYMHVHAVRACMYEYVYMHVCFEFARVLSSRSRPALPPPPAPCPLPSPEQVKELETGEQSEVAIADVAAFLSKAKD